MPPKSSSAGGKNPAPGALPAPAPGALPAARAATNSVPDSAAAHVTESPEALITPPVLAVHALPLPIAPAPLPLEHERGERHVDFAALNTSIQELVGCVKSLSNGLMEEQRERQRSARQREAAGNSAAPVPTRSIKDQRAESFAIFSQQVMRIDPKMLESIKVLSSASHFDLLLH